MRTKHATAAYEYLGAHSDAAESFQKAGLWQECLFSAAQIPDSHELNSRAQLRSLAQSLMGELVELKDYSSAARISLDYLGNTPEGVRLFCRANKYGEAMRIVSILVSSQG